MGRNKNGLEVAFHRSQGASMTAVRRSRIKLFAAIIGTSLVIAPSPWAFKTFDTNRGANETTPVGTHEQVEIIDGEALGLRSGTNQSASARDAAGGLTIDFGEIQAGDSAVFENLFGLRNSGDTTVEVVVEAVGGLTETPMHTSVSGNSEPGVFEIEPDETVPVDVAVAVDLAAERGDRIGSFVVKTTTGLHNFALPALATVTNADQGSILNALLGALNEDLQAGFGRLGDGAAGLEPAEFVVDGVWDGGAYSHDVMFTWKATGPMRDVKVSLDGIAIPDRASATNDGGHTLVLEGSIMGSIPVRQEIRFTIDRTAPEATIAVPRLSFSPAQIAVHATDPSGVVGVEVFVATTQPPQDLDPNSLAAGAKPKASASPEPQSSPSSPEGSDSSSQDEATPSPTAEPTPEPTPTPIPDGEPVRHQAVYDPVIGAWLVALDLPPGYYNVWATAFDPLQNTVITSKKRIEIMKRPA